MGSLYDEFIDAKDMIEKQMIYQKKLVDTQRLDIFKELEANSYQSKNLLLLISKILSINLTSHHMQKLTQDLSKT